MKKFKDGDEVRLLKNWWKFKKGDILTIKAHYSNKQLYIPSSPHNPHGNWIEGSEDYFSLIKEIKTEVDWLNAIQDNFKEGT